jgi:hypothetical protein
MAISRATAWQYHKYSEILKFLFRQDLQDLQDLEIVGENSWSWLARHSLGEGGRVVLFRLPFSNSNSKLELPQSC